MLLCQFCKNNNFSANSAFKKKLLSHKEIYIILNLGRLTKVESKKYVYMVWLSCISWYKIEYNWYKI